jgi:hypothetical protein
VVPPSRQGGGVAKRQEAAPCGFPSRLVGLMREAGLANRELREAEAELDSEPAWRSLLSLRDPAGAKHAAPGHPKLGLRPRVSCVHAPCVTTT